MQDGSTRLPFSEVEEAIAPLLRTYAPPVNQVLVTNPFLRLANDGFWAVTQRDGTPWPDTTVVPAPGRLREADPTAGFDQLSLSMLRQHPNLAVRAARMLLETNFPASIQQEVVQALGLDLEPASALAGFKEEQGLSGRRRDPEFRERVLNAYHRRCVCCGFSLRIGDGLVAVDAAHIRWHTHDGPDHVTNGVALCALHHRLFDHGVLTIDLDRRICVAESVNGEHADKVTAHHGKPASDPHTSDAKPAENFLKWHHRNVFKGRSGHRSIVTA
jgi:putative restriction endonuclease